MAGELYNDLPIEVKMAAMDMSSSSATTTAMSEMANMAATTTSMAMSMSGMDMDSMTTSMASMDMSGMDMGSSTMASMSGMDMGTSTASSAMAAMSSGSMSSMSSMSSSTSHSCKISMLWNWYTIDSCFIAKSWHNHTRGHFAGSCIGVFLIVLGAEWLHRLDYEYNLALAKRRRAQYMAKNPGAGVDGHESDSTEGLKDAANSPYVNEGYLKTSVMPILETLKHSWYWNFLRKNRGEVYPNALDHVLRSVFFTIQWLLSYLIMLLFMYYNGYIIISCMLGALFGHLLFSYKPLCFCSGEVIEHPDARKCCM
ncbi:unnamed protein product [Ambrosiozyma monospora]|uniref:Unnamed protein product n=1 Tax=Ambrosiozyma monospora TaxID=43982 RepID=A0ACB5SW05_AMBMO|nr:unnamed protein product [Ambrosiozyma monospora]